jgi:hypothetical protein
VLVGDGTVRSLAWGWEVGIAVDIEGDRNPRWMSEFVVLRERMLALIGRGMIKGRPDGNSKSQIQPWSTSFFDDEGDESAYSVDENV